MFFQIYVSVKRVVQVHHKKSKIKLCFPQAVIGHVPYGPHRGSYIPFVFFSLLFEIQFTYNRFHPFWCQVLWVLTHIYSHATTTIVKMWWFYHPPKSPRAPLQSEPTQSSPSWHWCAHWPYSFAFPRISYKWNPTACSFWDRLLTLSIMHLKFIHVVVWVSALCSFFDCSMVLMIWRHSVCPFPTEGHLGCFEFGVIMRVAPVNLGLCVNIYFFISPG